MKLNRTRLFVQIALAVLVLGPVPAALHMGSTVAQAQNIGQRAVSGLVVDDTSTPIAGATVFLKNEKTKTIRSYSSSADGKFRFVQVNMADDHEIWAEKDGHKSPVKTVSSWDARKDVPIELKLK